MFNENVESFKLRLKNHRRPKLTFREKANDKSWTRHALCDSVSSYERNLA